MWLARDFAIKMQEVLKGHIWCSNQIKEKINWCSYLAKRREKNGFVLHQMDQWIHPENVDQLLQANTCTTSIPFATLPKTVCLLSNHGVATVVIKNWEPLVFGPALAMETVKGLSCRKLQETEEKIIDVNINLHVNLKNHSKQRRSYLCHLMQSISQQNYGHKKPWKEFWEQNRT